MISSASRGWPILARQLYWSIVISELSIVPTAQCSMTYSKWQWVVKPLKIFKVNFQANVQCEAPGFAFKLFHTNRSKILH